MTTFLAERKSASTRKAVSGRRPHEAGKRDSGRLGGARLGIPLFMRRTAFSGSPLGSLNPDPVAARGLGAHEREHAERRIGVKLHGVRIHDDEQTRSAVTRVGAHAFSRGDDVFFGSTVGTAFGPDRSTALVHELTHVAQVRRGRRTGKFASEATLEREARGITSGAIPVREGATADRPRGFWGLFEDEEDAASGSSSDSDSDSAHPSGMQRSVWDHIVEAVTGVAEAGPVDAYDAAFGEDAEAAAELGSTYPDTWQENAARHGVWQARLAFKHGSAQAEALANAHEEGSPDALDSWIDQYNNRVARQIGERAGSLEEISSLIERAIEDGDLISDPADPRIPAGLRRSE